MWRDKPDRSTGHLPLAPTLHRSKLRTNLHFKLQDSTIALHVTPNFTAFRFSRSHPPRATGGLFGDLGHATENALRLVAFALGRQ